MTELIAVIVKVAPEVAIVIIFLVYQVKRDKDWQSFIEKLLADKEKPINDVVQVLKEFRDAFVIHDSWEHTKLEDMEKVQKERTRPLPRSRKSTDD